SARNPTHLPLAIVGGRDPSHPTSGAMTKQRLDGPGIQEQLLGTWKMLAWRRQVVATGEVSDALGPEPRSFITYTADTRVMVLVVKRDRPMPSNLTPTPAEKIALYDRLFPVFATHNVVAV